MNLIVKGKPGPYEKISGVVVHIQIIDNEGDPQTWLVVWNSKDGSLETVQAKHILVDAEMMQRAVVEAQIMNAATGIGKLI